MSWKEFSELFIELSEFILLNYDEFWYWSMQVGILSVLFEEEGLNDRIVEPIYDYSYLYIHFLSFRFRR